jgi:antitoxin VapB
MALQIANPKVIAKIEALAKSTGLTKTAAVEKAVDELMAGRKKNVQSGSVWQRLDSILKQIDRVPDISSSFDPLEWDEQGLPR